MKSAIAWFDIPTLDFERAHTFYSTILGQTLEIEDFMGQKLGYFPMSSDGEVGGDLVPPDPTFIPSSQGTRVYLNCEGKLDEVISRIELAGGKIVRPKFQIGDQGFIVIIQDTEGNIVGLHSK